MIAAARAAKRALAPAAGPRRLPVGVGRGLRLTIDFDHHAGLYLGLYEIELNRHLRRLCPPGTACFDVGGSFGYDALVLARLGGARVATFEPDPRALTALRRNLALNPGEAARIEVVEGAVGREPPGRLDDAVESLFAPGFVKVDVDGAEVDVLAGASRMLETVRPALVVETHAADLERACAEILRGHRYGVRVVDQRRVLRDHRPIPHNRWLIATART